MVDMMTFEDQMTWLYIGVPLWALAIFLHFFWRGGKNLPLDVIYLRKKYLSLQPVISANMEKIIPIGEMYVYPVRGIRAGA